MKNLYHSDIYKFDTPVSSYWEDVSSENLNLEKLTKDINSEIVVIGAGYTGLLCAINLIENYNLDVILVEAGKVGWGASSRNAGFNCLPPSKMSFKKMQSIYGVEETKKFFKNSVEASNHTKDIIKEYIMYLDNVIFDNTIVTKTELFREFYKAEDYHQGYYKLNKDQQYCKVIISPKIIKAREKLNKYYKK